MQTNITELVFILDRSGSMSGLESDAIGGFNSMLDKQQREPGEALLTTVLFDDKYELLHDRAAIKGVLPITDKEYYVRGCTALLDAIGRTIAKIDNAQKNIAEESRADRVLFAITTDGYENASREYDYGTVKRLVEQKKACGWEFLFLGANIDAIGTAAKFGITPDRSVNYRGDGRSVGISFEAMSRTASDLRAHMPITADWKSSIESDYFDRED